MKTLFKMPGTDSDVQVEHGNRVKSFVYLRFLCAVSATLTTFSLLAFPRAPAAAAAATFINLLFNTTTTSQVTRKFCEWVTDLGGGTNNIEESTVMSLFASGYETKVRECANMCAAV